MISIAEMWRSFLRSFRHHSVTQTATLLVVSGVFGLMVFSLLLTVNLNSILTKWGASNEITVFLRDESTADNFAKLNAAIASEPGAANIKFISKEQALKDFSRQLSGYAPKILKDSAFRTSLPASLQFSFSSPRSLPDLVALAQRLNQLEGVEDVSYGQGWIENYARFIGGFSRITYFAVLILAFGSLLIIANSLRASFGQRRAEIEILELVGATYTSIRLPLLFEGGVIGAVASSAALACNYGIYLAVRNFLLSDFSFLGVADLWNFSTVPMIVTGIVFGTLIGVAGAYLCVRKINDGWAARGTE